MDLKLKGINNVLGKEIPNIEGGFGDNKKSMLVKDVANFHNKEEWRINENIKRNSNKFRNGIDIIDIKGTSFAIDLCESEILSQNKINASKNIYVVSERGYAKLIKIFDDDLAWEMYDKLLDNYFDMREEKELDIQGELDLMQKAINIMQKQEQAINNNSEKIDSVENKVTNLTEQSVPDDYISLAGLAQRLDLYSSTNRLHSQLAGAIARKAGINIDEDPPYEDEMVKVAFSSTHRNPQTYLSPKAVKSIEKWWAIYEGKFKYQKYYQYLSQYGYPGDLKEKGYKIGKRTYRTFVASKANSA